MTQVMPEQIAQMYKNRWQIEVYFGWIKQRLNIPISTEWIETIQVIFLTQNLFGFSNYMFINKHIFI
ncbi:transposase [Paenibacillus sp. N3.4]|uniref:transposase n=1 Tax=Paenibacillus sp. N3.4 TaxID=2603222 RepID=UPI0021C27122|nr:transposase [Paenibacillus sp. N3.4]